MPARRLPGRPAASPWRPWCPLPSSRSRPLDPGLALDRRCVDASHTRIGGGRRLLCEV